MSISEIVDNSGYGKMSMNTQKINNSRMSVNIQKDDSSKLSTILEVAPSLYKQLVSRKKKLVANNIMIDFSSQILYIKIESKKRYLPITFISDKSGKNYIKIFGYKYIGKDEYAVKLYIDKEYKNKISFYYIRYYIHVNDKMVKSRFVKTM